MTAPKNTFTPTKGDAQDLGGFLDYTATEHGDLTLSFEGGVVHLTRKDADAATLGQTLWLVGKSEAP